MSQLTFKGSHFPKCVILQAVFWYLRYSLSYRDIEELMVNERTSAEILQKSVSIFVKVT